MMILGGGSGELEWEEPQLHSVPTLRVPAHPAQRRALVVFHAGEVAGLTARRGRSLVAAVPAHWQCAVATAGPDGAVFPSQIL